MLEILPDSDVELILSFGSRAQFEEGSKRHDLPHSYVVGLADRPVPIHIEGILKVVAVRFYAWGIYSLLGRGPSQRPITPSHLDDLLRPVLGDIDQAVQDDNAELAVTILQNHLIERAAFSKYDPSVVQTATQQIIKEKGRVKIGDLADYCYISPRQLERQFEALVGLQPKALARLIRFEQVRYLLQREPMANLATLANHFGYSDQAHLTREFKHFSQRTPTQFVSAIAAQRQLLL